MNKTITNQNVQCVFIHITFCQVISLMVPPVGFSCPCLLLIQTMNWSSVIHTKMRHILSYPLQYTFPIVDIAILSLCYFDISV